MRLSQFGMEWVQKTTAADPRVTQAVLKILADEPSRLRVTQAVLKVLSYPVIDTFTLQDFVYRVDNLLPKPWWSKEALLPGGVTYVFILAIAKSLWRHKTQQLDYAKDQMRIMTATGSNLDNIALDFLGTTIIRLPGEPDANFRRRIIQAIIGPKVTLAAMQAALKAYYATVFSTTYPERPASLVFDQQSNPTLAAAYGCVPPQFVVEIEYPVPGGYGWILGQSNLGRTTVLFPTTGYLPFDPARVDPGLKNVVDTMRAEGTQPLYAARYRYY
jgi:hypothetical protein